MNHCTTAHNSDITIAMILSMVFALQLQCGVQQMGDSVLSYGTLIYTSQESSTPALAYFEQKGPAFSNHPFCLFLQDKMNTQQTFQIRLDETGKRILGVR